MKTKLLFAILAVAVLLGASLTVALPGVFRERAPMALEEKLEHAKDYCDKRKGEGYCKGNEKLIIFCPSCPYRGETMDHLFERMNYWYDRMEEDLNCSAPYYHGSLWDRLTKWHDPRMWRGAEQANNYLGAVYRHCPEKGKSDPLVYIVNKDARYMVEEVYIPPSGVYDWGRRNREDQSRIICDDPEHVFRDPTLRLNGGEKADCNTYLCAELEIPGFEVHETLHHWLPPVCQREKAFFVLGGYNSMWRHGAVEYLTAKIILNESYKPHGSYNDCDLLLTNIDFTTGSRLYWDVLDVLKNNRTTIYDWGFSGARLDPQITAEAVVKDADKSRLVGWLLFWGLDEIYGCKEDCAMEIFKTIYKECPDDSDCCYGPKFIEIVNRAVGNDTTEWVRKVNLDSEEAYKKLADLQLRDAGCGNGICEFDENPKNCPQDCEIPPPPPGYEYVSNTYPPVYKQICEDDDCISTNTTIRIVEVEKILEGK